MTIRLQRWGCKPKFPRRELSICTLKEPCLPEAVVSSAQGICTSSSNDNMVQQRDIHRGRRLSELPCELYIRSAWTWVATWMVV